jgi:hypothetical protein
VTQIRSAIKGDTCRNQRQKEAAVTAAVTAVQGSDAAWPWIPVMHVSPLP